MSAPDFHQIVSLALKPRNDREEETCRELADHLADQYENALHHGQSLELAAQSAHSQLRHASRLRRQIRRAQGGSMSSLFRKMLLPGVLMVLIVQAFAIPLGYLGFRPHAYLFWHYAAFVSYWFLMPGFLVAAAMGAWYSRHQGGDFRDRLVAGTFYAIASLFACVLPLPLAFVVDPHVAWSTRFEAVTGYILSQVVVPGIPMLLGTLPFLFSKESDQVIGIRPRRKRTYFFDTSSS